METLRDRARERSARIVSAYLQEQGASQESIEQVIRFIWVHEYGGNEDENFVQAADSLSFLEVNVDSFLNWLDADNTIWDADAVRAKFTCVGPESPVLLRLSLLIPRMALG